VKQQLHACIWTRRAPADRAAILTRGSGGVVVLSVYVYVYHEDGTAHQIFGSFKIPKILQDSPSHQIFRRMHEALNVGKKIINYTVCM
jgi:hypothetical protein